MSTESASSKAVMLEFTVEPFVESSPGPHVIAAIEAAKQGGLQVDVGPFGTVVTGQDSDVLSATHQILVAAFENGASRVSLQLTAEDHD